MAQKTVKNRRLKNSVYLFSMILSGIVGLIVSVQTMSQILQKPNIRDFTHYTFAGQIGMTVTNYGILGEGYETCVQPSCRYKLYSEYKQEQVLLHQGNEIMNTDRNGKPTDIYVDSRNVIYIADAGLNYIQPFDSQGSFVRNIGTAIVDSLEVGYIFNRPESVVCEDDILYVADTGNARIVRFQYVVLAEQNVSRGDD